MLKKIASYFIVLCVGGILGGYFNSSHVIEEKVVTKDRIQTVVKEIIRNGSDGSSVIERETVTDQTRDQVQAKKETIPAKKDWGVSVKTSLFSTDTVYTAEVHRRVFSDLYVSVYGRTDNTLGVGVTFFF